MLYQKATQNALVLLYQYTSVKPGKMSNISSSKNKVHSYNFLPQQWSYLSVWAAYFDENLSSTP